MKRYLFLLLLLPLLSASEHKFYVSKTIIEFNPRSGSFEITCKLFTDDLEMALGSAGGKPIRLGTDQEPSNANDLIEDYIKKHFILKYNDEPIYLSFVGKEAEADLTYCYMEFVKPQEYNTISIESTIFYELYPEQQNIVDVKANASTKTVVLIRDKSKEVIFR